MKHFLLVGAVFLTLQSIYAESAQHDLILPVNPPIYLHRSPVSMPPSQGRPARRPIAKEPRVLLERKLDGIVIPQFNIHEATIQDAIRFLREAAKQNDTISEDSRQRGINLLLKTVSSPPSPEPQFTLRLENLSLREVLRHLSALSHATMHVDPYAVALVRQ